MPLPINLPWILYRNSKVEVMYYKKTGIIASCRIILMGISALKKVFAEIEIFFTGANRAEFYFHIAVFFQHAFLIPIRPKRFRMKADGNAGTAFVAVHGIEVIPITPIPSSQEQLHCPIPQRSRYSLIKSSKKR